MAILGDLELVWNHCINGRPVVGQQSSESLAGQDRPVADPRERSFERPLHSGREAFNSDGTASLWVLASSLTGKLKLGILTHIKIMNRL